MMMNVSILVVSVLGAEITYFLIHKYHQPTVRASSLSALLFALAVSALNISFGNALQAAFFGATFVGMTDKSRLGWKRVFVASLVFGLIFVFLIPLAKGIGGSLGTAAFVSSSVVYLLSKMILKKKIHP